MKCQKCQSDIKEGASFCEDCGARLELACPACSADVTPGKRFCADCGHDLREPATAPAPELSFEEKLDKIQRYLPGGLTEKILAQRGKIEGERKQVTVMFCDAEGFTSLSERLGPERVYSIMDEVFETLIHKVHEFGGTVNKMTGDGIMALFGAPIALEDAPQRAIRSALAIQRDIPRLSDRKKEETGDRPIRMRIGIHTGPVVVGSLGNDLRVEFTAMGDTVNLASRMEGLAEPGTVYVTEDTFKLTEGLFRFEALGEKEVKGKKAPVKAYRVIAPSTRRTRFDVSAERGLTPFLGRERELELLLDGIDRARSGRGQAFSIMGEAGVGKSRLLYELRKATANEDVTFIEGKCLSYSTNVAYHPVIDLLKSNFDIQEGDDDDRIRDRVKGGLKDMGIDEDSALPFVLELLSVRDSGIDALGLTPEARKARTLEALRRIVLKGSEMRPLVLAIEDLHWVDNSSEDTLKSLLEAISGAQVLLLFTYRPEFVHTWGAKSYHSQVNLLRLSNRETLAMAAHILGTEGIEGTLEELILEKTEGIPFFVEEFMKSLKDLGMIEWRDSGYYLAKDIKDGERHQGRSHTEHYPRRHHGEGRFAARSCEEYPADRLCHRQGIQLRADQAGDGDAGGRADSSHLGAEGLGAALRAGHIPPGDVHLQARADAGGGVRQPAAEEEAGDAQQNSAGDRGTLPREAGGAVRGAGPSLRPQRQTGEGLPVSQALRGEGDATVLEL